MDRALKAFLIGAAVVLFGGGLLSMALGADFWGRRPATVVPDRGPPSGPFGPNQSPACGTDCAKCHGDKF